MTLTLVTGVIDAVSLLTLGRIFVATMTGNVVATGFALGGLAEFSLLTSLVALGAFLGGATAGGLLVDRSPARGSLLRVAVGVDWEGLTVSTDHYRPR